MRGFNPMQFFGMPQGNGFNPMQFFSNQGNNTPLNRDQFKQFLPNMNEQIYAQLQAQARQRGISEEDIQKGMEFIRSLTR